jgi:hypothetical protein
VRKIKKTPFSSITISVTIASQLFINPSTLLLGGNVHRTFSFLVAVVVVVDVGKVVEGVSERVIIRAGVDGVVVSEIGA